jgi:hypothetical protein
MAVWQNEISDIYEQRQNQINQRVLALEQQQAIYASKACVMVPPNGPTLKYIQNFSNVLFPETHKQETLKVLFNMLYKKRKSFRAHVDCQIKPALLLLV